MTNGRRLLETSESAWAIPVNPTEVVALMLTEDLLAPVEGSWLAEPLAKLRSRLSATLTPTSRRYCAELRKANVAAAFESFKIRRKLQTSRVLCPKTAPKSTP